LSTFTSDDLVAWSERLPNWQRDALRRVVLNNLTDTDIAELSSMAKWAAGLTESPVPAPEPVTREQVRADPTSQASISVLTIRDIANVNALAAGPITFAAEGLTVVYGDNASGKSGIARILKKAGRSRSPGGLIRPSVFEPDPGQPASATIEFRVGGDNRTFSWIDGAPSDHEFSAINVFDANCATIQIEESSHLAYTPPILHIFHELARACHDVGNRLRTEKEQLENARAPEIRAIVLNPSTPAGILVSNISHETRLQDIDSLCDLTEADRERSDLLTRALRENPTSQADLLDSRARRLRELDEFMAGLERTFSEIAVTEFDSKLSDTALITEAATAARQAFAANSSLAGIGMPAWNELWESARRYSVLLAYPAQMFPVTRDDALCVLCQQPVGRTAAERMLSFERFVQDDIQQRAVNAVTQISTQKAAFEAIRIPLSTTVLRETGLGGTLAAQSTKAFLIAAKIRKRYLLAKAAGRSSQRPSMLPPRPNLTAIRETVAEEIRNLRAAAGDAERASMQTEFRCLQDRLTLAPLKEILRGEVSRLRTISLLEIARASCDTTGITRKGGEVAKVVVTARLRSEFAGNVAHLGFGAVPVEVKLGPGTVGQHPYHLSLIAREDVPPSEVLSEGEKTCVALAGFLAELEATNNHSGIILDDPVSSLDHHYRLRVAQRLIAAAKLRQVVIFTHDIVFLLMLTKYARAEGVAVSETSLRRGGPQHGVPETGPPWIAMPVSRRIGVLRNELQRAAALLRNGDRPTYEQKAEWIYKRLRQSWERAVEEILLNGVVVRFGDGVSTQRLRLLTDITEEDVQCVDTQMSYCSSFVHDECGAVNSGIPDPATVESDIKRLEDWVAAIGRRRR
jgi:hypothetical protein